MAAAASPSSRGEWTPLRAWALLLYPSFYSPPKPEVVLATFLATWNCTKGEFAQNAKAGLIVATCNLFNSVVLVGTLYHCWIMPKVNETLSRERSKMKYEIIQDIKRELEIKGIHIDGERRKAEGQSIQTSGGHDKEHGGRQASDDLDEA